jgi:hypothetical protein
MTEYEVALISGALAIAGTLLGVIFTYRLSIKSADRQFGHLKTVAKLDAWHIAAREFIQAFAPQIAALEANSEKIGDVMDYLRRTFDTHSAAVAAFTSYVPDDRVLAFRAAWQRHCYDDEDPNDRENPKWSGLDHDSLLFLHYSNEFHLARPTSARDEAVKRMQALLGFAKDA